MPKSHDGALDKSGDYLKHEMFSGYDCMIIVVTCKIIFLFFFFYLLYQNNPLTANFWVITQWFLFNFFFFSLLTNAGASRAPQSLEAMFVQPTEVSLSWREVACVQQNAVTITGYVVRYYATCGADRDV